MIGQQKRPLEHPVSSQPMKYQKHFDDSLCEANTRVVPLTDEKLEFQQHFSGVSQKNAFPISPGTSCDSIKVFEKALASELGDSHGDKLPSELESGAQWGSHEGGVLSEEPGAVGTVGYPSAQSAKELKIECRNVQMGHPMAAVNGTLGKAELMETYVVKDTEERSSLSVLPKENQRKRWGLLGGTSRELSMPLGIDEQISLPQVASGPSHCKSNSEGGTSFESVQKTIDLRPNCSGPLPVLMSEQVVDLNMMHEQVQRFGGYDSVTSEGMWSTISEALGLGSDCGPGLKLIYFKYLRGFKRENRLLLETEQDNALVGSLSMNGTGFSDEKRVVIEKGENYYLAVGEQFAESEPLHEKSGLKEIKGSSSSLKRDDYQEVDHSEVETQRASIRREREAKPNEQCRTDADEVPRISKRDYPFLGNCGFSQECDDIPSAGLPTGRLLRGRSDYSETGGVLQGRDLESNVAEDVMVDEFNLEDHKSVVNTLMWIKRMALEPGNPYMGQGPDGTGQNEDWVLECVSQASKVRALLWKRRDEMRPGDGHSHQSKQIPGPSLYYEELPRHEQQPLERLRATKERAAHYGSPSAQMPLHESVSLQRGFSSSLTQPQWVGQASHRLPRQSHFYYEERYSEDLVERPRKRIPIGPDYQVHIPLWRSVDHSSSVADSGRAGPSGEETQSSDEEDEDSSRFLGQQVWPPRGSKRFAYRDQLEQGRPPFNSCSCLDPESLTCVRVHIQEERERLKQKLGQAFYIWKFDEMGESVADSWTKDEEQTFRALVKMNPPSQEKNFWVQLPEAFPGKKTRELVSYYFNVFVFRRRAIQNRHYPQHVDSDDDETDLPEGVSEDSEDYESGEEVDEELDEDASEEEDESDRPYEDERSGKLLEDTGVCDPEGVNMVYTTKMGGVSTQDESEGISMRLRSRSLMNLDDSIQQGYHNCQEERGVRLHTTHMTAKWSHEHHDHEKHLEEHISIVGEEELQEVKTWEASHWDEAGQEDLVHDPVLKMMVRKDEQFAALCTERDPTLKKAMDGTNQHTSIGSGEGEVWGTTMDIALIKERDKLLSTNGMIQEFFGDEASGLDS